MTTSGSGERVITAGIPPVEDGSSPILPLQLRVEKMAFSHAVPYLVEHHYLHRRSSIPKLTFGVFHGWRCVGVLVFGQPVARLEDQETTLELNRFWLSDDCGKNSESRLLGVCCRLIRKYAPEIRRVIAYSDSSMGHAGTIYKASGWHAVKVLDSQTKWSMPNRPRRNPRVMGIKTKWEKELKAPNGAPANAGPAGPSESLVSPTVSEEGRTGWPNARE